MAAKRRRSPLSPDEIRQLRHQLGVTQQQMATHMHVSLNSYKRWEWGIRRPNVKHSEKMRWMARKYGGWKRGQRGEDTPTTDT